jgi:RAP1 GTPase activating protein 1
LEKKIELSTWKQFRGGLDVKSGTTGTHTIYKRFNNNDIIFHVSTMLPFNPKDKQQLERKRHIGNDIVVIIFQDGETIYKPTTISSRQVHVVFVVKEFLLNNQKYYRLSVVSRDGVPDFGPEIPKNSIFPKNEDFLNFFYAKLLNAEKACYKAPILSNKISRTRTSILRDLAINFT